MNEAEKIVLTGAVVLAICSVTYMIERMKDIGRHWLALIATSMALLIFALTIHFAHARDDGRYANSKLKSWFDGLQSGKGPCCSDADGTALSDVDWDSRDGKYRVRINGEWIDVPEDAVLTQPNLYGKTMVWPQNGRWDNGGYWKTGIFIRCFIPGVMG